MNDNKQEKNITIKMAKNMYPSKEIWEEIGFQFTKIDYDDVLYNTTLPVGWTVQHIENSPWFKIIDNLGNNRGNMYFKATIYERVAHMNLFSKYRIFPSYENGDYSRRYIVFGNDEETLFVAGQVHGIKNVTKEATSQIHKEEKELIEKAKIWANENYPNWQKVDAYWDTPKKKTTKIKTKTK